MADEVLGRTVLELDADPSKLNRGLDSAEAKTKGFAASAKMQLGAAMGAAFGGIAVGALSMATSTDKAFDSIRAGTGATGAALEALQDDFRAVAGNVPDNIEVVGQVLADLNTRTGQTGEGLQNLTEQILDMSRITGTDATQNVALATRAFGDWSVAVEDQADTLDMFYRASQQTGIGVDKLMESVVQFGAPLRNIGYDLEESAAMLGKWEKEGVNTELALGGLKIALGEFAKEGVDAKEGLNGLIEQIQNATTDAEAMALGVEKFGSRAGPDMVAAIREGRFAFDDYTESIANGTETIADATTDTEDFADKLKGFANDATVALGGLLGPLAGLTTAIPGLKILLPVLGGAFGALTAAIGGTKVALTLLLGPIGIAIAAIGLLAAAFATDFLGIRTAVEGAVDDMAMNFGDMGDKVHRLADETGTDFKLMKDRIKTEMEETGDSFDQVVRRIENGGTAMTDAQWDAVEESGNAWAAYQAQITASVGAATTEVELGVDGMATDLGSLPEQGADEMLANQFHLTDATTQLVEFMKQALDPAQEMFNAQMFLASQEAAAGLESGNPLVVAKTEELIADANAVLARGAGAALGYGKAWSSNFAWGITEDQWKAQSAAAGMAQSIARIMPQSEPKDPSSPFRGITKWGGKIVSTIVGDMLAHVPDARSAAGMLAGALVPSLVPNLGGMTMPSMAGVSAMSGKITAGSSGAGVGGSIVNQWVLNVEGERVKMGTRDDVLDGWDTLGRFSDRSMTR